MNTSEQNQETNRLYSIAFGLSIFTIVYNIAEGLIAMYLGYEDETLALFGFGVDSLIEALSGLGIAHMVMRIRRNDNAVRDDFERTALHVTGYSFIVLAAGLCISAIINTITNHKPETTFWGVIIALVSIVVMVALMMAKNKVGRQLKSEAIIADSRCTTICIYMSVVLLIASALYELTNLAYIDTLATLGLAYFSYREGKECFAKAKSNLVCCD